MVGAGYSGALENVAARFAIWPAVIALCAGAFHIARDLDSFAGAAALTAVNFELLRWRREERSFLAYFNSAYFCVLVMLEGYFSRLLLMRGIPLSTEIVLGFTALVAWMINRRYGSPPLTALVHLLLVSTVVGATSDLWQHFYVPKHSVRGYSLALDLYYNWSKPAEILFVAGPFLASAVAQDIRAKHAAPTSPVLDAYYSYSLPFLAFGLFPGVGRSLQGNCENLGTYVAIAGIAGLVSCGVALALVFNRRSILIGAAASCLLLGVNRCVELPIELMAVAVTAAMLIAWRWLPKGRNWPDRAVPA